MLTEPTLLQSTPTLAGEPDLAQQFRALCTGHGPTPDVRDFVRQAGTLSPRQLVAILCVDLRQCWQRGETVRAETYLADFPILEQNPDSFLDLVYTEVLLQEQSGAALNLEDYRQRFPQLFERLKEQVEFGQTLRQQAEQEASATPNVPGYEILQRLGEGGVGVVYRARQCSLGREVALKMLKEAPGDRAQQMERFQREAATIARLKHPNIVQIHEIGEHHGLPFLCLEYVAGGTLAERLRKGPLPPREAATLVQALAQTMHSVHQEGIIHRDLKPGNVLLTADGVPRITDFGLARLLDSQSELTQTGFVLGTPSYMAPEQAAGKVHEIGPATDVYALGAILYELLTGRPPFVGATVLETLEQVRTLDPVSPISLQPRVPRDLETICLKCLEKEARRRYPSAEALARDLQCFLAGEPISARSVTALERLTRAVAYSGWHVSLRSQSLALLLLAPIPVAVQVVLLLLFGSWPSFPVICVVLTILPSFLLLSFLLWRLSEALGKAPGATAVMSGR